MKRYFRLVEDGKIRLLVADTLGVPGRDDWKDLPIESGRIDHIAVALLTDFLGKPAPSMLAKGFAEEIIAGRTSERWEIAEGTIRAWLAGVRERGRG